MSAPGSPAALTRWQVAGLVIGLAAIIQCWTWLESRAMPGGAAASAWHEAGRSLLQTAMVLVMGLATLRADRAVAQGMRPLWAQGGALLAGATAAAALYRVTWAAVPWLDPTGTGLAWAHTAKVWLDHLLWGSIFFWVHAAVRERWRAATRMKALQMERSTAQRRAAQMELQALQARVEPQFLFGTLTHIRQLYEQRPHEAGAMLDQLVDYLRAALPHLRETGSTVERELRLARAYLALRWPPVTGRPAAKVQDVPPALRDAPLAPMLLLPLLARLPEAALCAGDPLSIGVRRVDGLLEIHIAPAPPLVGNAEFEDLLADLRERLATLHGEQARLTIENDPELRLVLAVPHEAPSRTDR